VTSEVTRKEFRLSFKEKRLFLPEKSKESITVTHDCKRFETPCLKMKEWITDVKN
jgi:hypothetical protein